MEAHVRVVVAERVHESRHGSSILEKTERERGVRPDVGVGRVHQGEERGHHVTFQLLGFDLEPASTEVARALELDAQARIYRLRRLRLVEDAVIGLEDRAMSEHVGSAIPAAALVSRSAVTMVESALGTPLGGMTVSVGATAAHAQLARDLGVRRGSPVLVRDHTFYDSHGHPVLVGCSLYRGDKYRFTYRFGRHGE